MNMALCLKPIRVIIILHSCWTVSSVKMFKLFFYPSLVLLYIISSFLVDLISTSVFSESPKKNEKQLFKYSEQF